jgi:hypothetical protein
MLEKSFGLLFFLKQPQNYQSGPMYIYMRITVDGVVKELSTKRLWEPTRWNSKAAKATGNKEDVKILNGYLDTLRNKVFEAKKILLDNNKQVTAIAIKDFLSGKEENKRMILDVFAEHNK